MSDERIVRALADLGAERPSPAADSRMRELLERSWDARTTRPRAGRRPFVVLAGVAIALALFARVALVSSADSPLYDLRVALEEVAIGLHVEADDRYSYVLSLAADRGAEADRWERAGNADAATRAHRAETDALRFLGDQHTPPPSPVVLPSPTPSPTDTPAPPTPMPTPSPISTVRPTPTATPRPTPTPTKPPAVSPTPTPLSTYIYGTVQWPDGTNANGVCVSTARGGTCFAETVNGTFGKTVTAKVGMTITLYFQITDLAHGGTFVASGSATVTNTLTSFGVITLAR